MTPDDFRTLALSFPETEEKSHMRHPDFRVRGRVFATLSYPDESWGMVKLPPTQQETFVQAEPDAFVPATGAWGRQGCTSVRLNKAKKTMVKSALAEAWREASAKQAASSKKKKH
jgi:hypothetical protein